MWKILCSERNEKMDHEWNFADYFTAAVRTGGPGIKRVSLILLLKKMEGI